MHSSVGNKLSSYLNLQDAGYLSEIDAISKQIPPLDGRHIVSVMLPVSSEESPSGLLSTIRLLALNQTLDPSKYEIVANINYQHANSFDEQKAKLLAENLENFKEGQKNKIPSIAYFVRKYANLSIGRVRKEIADVILYRILQNDTHYDHGLISVDADTQGLGERFMESHVTNLGESPCSHGILDWDAQYFKDLPELQVGLRFMQYVQAYHRNKRNYIPTPGANFGFRSSVYAEVGGYSLDRSFIDRIIGRKMVALGTKYDNFKFSPGAKLKVNSRRAIITVLNGLSPIEQWENDSFAKDSRVRSLSESELKVRVTNFRLENDLESSILRVLLRTIELYKKWGLSECDRGITKALSLLGVRYETAEDKIKITSIDKLIEALSELK